MNDFLEYLFDSKTKVRIIKLLIFNDGMPLKMDDIVAKVDGQKKYVQKELKEMLALNFIQAKLVIDKVSYIINPSHDLYNELKMLIAKASVNPSNLAIEKIKKLDGVVYAAFTGSFVGNKKTSVDFFIAGDDLDKEKVKKIVTIIEADAGREINYTVMDTTELLYRLDLLDKFIKDIFKEKKIVIIDRVKERKYFAKKRNLNLTDVFS